MMAFKSRLSCPSVFFVLMFSQAYASEKTSEQSFQEALGNPWKQVFLDAGHENWRAQWFMDGRIGKVSNHPEGMVLEAGPEFKNNEHHIVLWTKKSFEEDLKIEFDYTRLDDETRCVNIIYIQATGSGIPPYHEDIYQWKNLRDTPSMEMYYKHMHTYHISFAAFPNNNSTTSYLRARRYLPESQKLKGTDLEPTYSPEGLFEKGVPHHLTIIKLNREILVQIKNPSKTFHAVFGTQSLPEIQNGRVGIRHMFTRSARYKNFSISTF